MGRRETTQGLKRTRGSKPEKLLAETIHVTTVDIHRLDESNVTRFVITMINTLTYFKLVSFTLVINFRNLLNRSNNFFVKTISLNLSEIKINRILAQSKPIQKSIL